MPTCPGQMDLRCSGCCWRTCTYSRCIFLEFANLVLLNIFYDDSICKLVGILTNTKPAYGSKALRQDWSCNQVGCEQRSTGPISRLGLVIGIFGPKRIG